MKLKLMIVDFEVSPYVKKWALRLGIPAAVLFGGGAVAYAAGLVTWTAGETLTAADLNANFSLLQSKIAALQVTPSGFQALLSTDQTPSSTGATVVPFDNVQFDLNSEYTAATGTFSPKNAGTYAVYCSLLYKTTDAAVNGVRILVNGTLVADNSNAQPPSSSGFDIEGVNVSSAVSLKAGDKVTCGTTNVPAGEILAAGTEPHGNVFYAVLVN